MAQPHPMEPVDTPPEFLPLSSEVERPDIAVDRIDAPGRLCEAVDVHGELESREVPPSPDEAGRAETRERADEPAADEDRMDINVVDGDKPDADLSNLIATLHRDEKLEVENAWWGPWEVQARESQITESDRV